MFSQGIIDRIEDLKLSTSSRISEMQKCTCPMVSMDIVLKEQFEYWYNGYSYNLWEDNTRLFAVSNLPFCYDNDLRNNVFEGNLLDLVNDDKIFPFLLFVDGTICKWSDIHVIKDTDYAYLKISNITWYEGSNTKLLYIPLPSKKIRYGEDSDYLARTPIKGLYFNDEKVLLKTPAFAKLGMRLEFLDPDIYFDILTYTKEAGSETCKLSSLNDRFEKDLDFSHSNFNTVILPQLDTNNIKLSMENIFIYNPTSKKFVDTEYMISDMNKNVSNSLMFGKSEETSFTYYIIIAYNTKVKAPANHFSAIGANAYTRKGVASLANITLQNTEEYQDILDGAVYPMVENFDFKFDSSKSYEQNVVNAAKYISKYNYALWNEAFTKNSPIKSYTYSGAQFLALSDKDGMVNYSRKHSDLIEDKVLVFVNSFLYRYHMDIVYKTNTILIPTFDIAPNDDVEVVLFTKCNNNVLDITFEENTPTYIHPEYNLNDCYIMTEDLPSDASYVVPENDEGRRQYVCDLKSHNTDANGNVTVKFLDKKNYGKRLKIVPKNQFRYYRYKKQAGMFKLVLPTQFNYCHDRDRYMVFVNGRKIDKNLYTITIMNKYRPFDRLVLYLSTILDESDYVDVFYLPENLRETYLENESSRAGVIRLGQPNNYPKLHALSKNTNMVFVNGRKINPRNLYDISMTDIGILYRGDTLHERYNVCIVEYLDIQDSMYRYLYGMKTIIRDIVGIDQDGKEHNIIGTNVNDIHDTHELTSEEEVKFKKLLLYDSWKYAVDTIQNSDLDIFGGSGTATAESLEDAMDTQLMNIFQMQRIGKNPPASIKENFAGLRSVLYDVVLDYYFTRSEATTGEPFVYDFEAQEFDNPYSANDEMHDLPDGYTYFTNDINNTLLVNNEHGTNLYYVEVYDDELGKYKKIIPIFPDRDKLYNYEIIDKIATPDLVRSGKLFRKLN